MTGYEFIKYRADHDSFIKAARYGNGMEVAVQIEAANRDKYMALRQEEDYKDAEDWFIEATMSCDRGEAIGWMSHFMQKAVAYGVETKNRDWITKFLAAWDLYNSLLEGITA